MEMALKRAGISAGDLDYINAHGTSTQAGDEIELKAVESLVGNAGGKISMSSTKSATGHLLGAAGAIEAIFSLLAIRDNVVPPTLNLDNPSVETAFDLVPHTRAQAQCRHRAVELLRLRRNQRIAGDAPSFMTGCTGYPAFATLGATVAVPPGAWRAPARDVDPWLT